MLERVIQWWTSSKVTKSLPVCSHTSNIKAAMRITLTISLKCIIILVAFRCSHSSRSFIKRMECSTRWAWWWTPLVVSWTRLIDCTRCRICTFARRRCCLWDTLCQWSSQCMGCRWRERRKLLPFRIERRDKDYNDDSACIWQTCMFASLFLRTIINIFIQVVFPNIIAYLDRNFKEEQNEIDF